MGTAGLFARLEKVYKGWAGAPRGRQRGLGAMSDTNRVVVSLADPGAENFVAASGATAGTTATTDNGLPKGQLGHPTLGALPAEEVWEL